MTSRGGNHSRYNSNSGASPCNDHGDSAGNQGNGGTSGTSAFQSSLAYHNKGHRRGHSYGGPISQSSAFHHAQLESRPSHPNAHHGGLSQHGNANLVKGHRRALSGCLPMVGMGAVAWSSLRELETTVPHQPFSNLRGLSPDESRPSSPDPNEARTAVKIVSGIRPESEKHSLHYMECGIGPCHLPKWFQRLANIKFFVSVLALLVTLQQAVASGYVNSVITTIEARFEIPSRFMGIVASAYEMGNVITVLFVSYLGAKRHIPRWIATGVLVMVLGCIMFTLPHFLAPDQNSGPGSHLQYVGGMEDSKEQGSTLNDSLTIQLLQGNKQRKNSFCKTVTPLQLQFTGSRSHVSQTDNDSLAERKEESEVIIKDLRRTNYFSTGCSIEITEEDGKKVTKTTEESYAQPFIFFMVAQLLLGCGGSPLFTLGITYVDDHVPAESSSVYIGIIYAMAAFGPVLGFLTGAWLLSIPDMQTASALDNQFVGLWWGGFLIAGVLLFVVCLPFFTFPKLSSAVNPIHEIPSVKDKDYVIEENPADGSSVTQLSNDVNLGGYGESLRDIPRSIWRLITNPTYVVTCLGGCMELNIVSGFVVFLPKYLETQFSLGKSDASLYTGGIAIPGACLGIFAGGFIMKKMQLKPSGAAKFVVATNLICLIGYGLFFFLGCENPKLAGATIPYPGTSDLNNNKLLDVNLTSVCNGGCACDSSLDAQFVCHNESGTTFFSPCHAGCSVNYTHCTCAENGEVTPGKCADNDCHTLEAFMVILFFMAGTVAVTQMPLLMIVMRSVAVEERSFALGMQFVIFRLFGYIPSPIIFGNVIDSACILWSVKKCSTLLPAVRGRCLLYDIQDFRYKYVGVLSGLKLLALALFLYDFLQLREKEKREEKESLSATATVALQAENLQLKSNSVISLDKCDLFEEGDQEVATATGT